MTLTKGFAIGLAVIGFGFGLASAYFWWKSPSGNGMCSGVSDISLAGYTQTFADEFDTLSIATKSPIGGARWVTYAPNGATGNFSGSVWDPAALSVANGILSLKLQQDALGNWHSGYLASVDETGAGFSATNGYFEACAQMPTSGTGSWPAFWLLYNNNSTNIGEEIDIFEWYGVVYSNNPQQNVIQQATHNWGSGGSAPSVFSSNIPVPAPLPWVGWHIYGVQIDSSHITFYIDGVQTLRTATPTPYMQTPLHIILNYAIGGGWPLRGIVNNSALQVDWVRAWALPPGAK
jgi:beta-glucanase (GH16 family)